jgi:hypothetical protein
MAWVLAVSAAWVAIAAFVAIVLGRGIRLADRKQAEAAAGPQNFVVDEDPTTPPPAADDGTPPEADDTAPPAGPEDPPPGRFRHPIPSARPSTTRPHMPHSQGPSPVKRFRP